MIDKQGIAAFVQRARHAALDAVELAYSAKVEAALDAALADLGLRELVDEAQRRLDAFVATVDALNERLGSRALYYDIFRETAPPSFRERLLRAGVLKHPELDAALAEKQRRLKEVTTAYRAVWSKIQRMRSAARAVRYLKELGFDTSSLEASAPAEALFPERRTEKDDA